MTDTLDTPDTTKPATPELLPCPFCGKRESLSIEYEGVIDRGHGVKDYAAHYVVCDASTQGPGGCGACGTYSLTKPEAIAAWNRRSAATPAAMDERAIRDHAREAKNYAAALVGYMPGGNIRRSAVLCEHIDALMDAALARAQLAAPKAMPMTHRHLRRGTLYAEIARGTLQTSVPLTDMMELVAYRGENGAWWFRPVSEFDDDDRFTLLPASSAPASQAGRDALDAAARDVLAERRRQIEAEGWDFAHDDEHAGGDMAYASVAYTTHAAMNLSEMPNEDDPTGCPTYWPWSLVWWKPSDPRRNLIKSAALILAEIERLDRAALAGTPGAPKA
jgi:hypothetical protein